MMICVFRQGSALINPSIQNISPHRILHTLGHLLTLMIQALMLKNKNASSFGIHIKSSRLITG